MNLRYYLAFYPLILGFSAALEFKSSNKTIAIGANRRLQTAACTLLLKIVSYKDGHDKKQVDCYDAETKSYLKVTTMQGRNINIQSELLSAFQTGAIKSGETTLLHAEAVIEGSYLVLPDDGASSTAVYGHSLRPSNRRLAVSGPLRFLAVRVVGSDSSPTFGKYAISNAWFGSYGQQLNFKSQAEACSNHAFAVSKVEGAGIWEGAIEVTVPTAIKKSSSRDVADEVLSIIADDLSIETPEHIILCFPTLDRDWAGWAYSDWYLTVYNGEYCLHTSTQMHEIGHNWNLGHSGYDGDEFGDESGVMGGTWELNVCFNAAMIRQLNFYPDKTVEVTSGWSGQLYGLSSYFSAGSDDAIILHIPKGTNGSSRDYYVSFNGASGINRDTQTGQNKVLVHHRVAGTDYTDYSDSTLAAILNSGKSYSGAPLKITVNSISGSTFAQVTIGTGEYENETCSDFPDTFRLNKRKIVSCSEMTPFRCSKKKGKSLCPNACGTTAFWCSRDAIGQVEYGVNENGESIYKGCKFVRRQPEKIASRCSKANIALACRATCQNYEVYM